MGSILKGCCGRCGWVLTALPLQRLEEQVGARQEELAELAAPLAGAAPEPDGQEQRLQQRFLELLEPLGRRRRELETSKAMYQLARDLEDETVSTAVAVAAGAAVPGGTGHSVGAVACSCGCRRGCHGPGRRTTAPICRVCSA